MKFNGCFNDQELELPHSLNRYAAGKVPVVAATGEARVAPDSPALGHIGLAADGQNKVSLVLHVAHVDCSIMRTQNQTQNFAFDFASGYKQKARLVPSLWKEEGVCWGFSANQKRPAIADRPHPYFTTFSLRSRCKRSPCRDGHG